MRCVRVDGRCRPRRPLIVRWTHLCQPPRMYSIFPSWKHRFNRSPAALISMSSRLWQRVTRHVSAPTHIEPTYRSTSRLLNVSAKIRSTNRRSYGSRWHLSVMLMANSARVSKTWRHSVRHWSSAQPVSERSVRNSSTNGIKKGAKADPGAAAA